MKKSSSRQQTSKSLSTPSSKYLTGKNFCVVVPTRGTIFTEHQMALETEFMNHAQYPMIVRTLGIPLPDSRNALLEAALKMPAWDYLLMVDDDIVVPKGAFKALQELLKDNDIAFIDYPFHYAGKVSKMKKASVTMYHQWLRGDTLEGKKIAWSGLGCVCVKRETIKKMAAKVNPLFRNTAHPLQFDEMGILKLTLTYEEGRLDNPMHTGGEDVQFFLEAQKMGLKVAMVEGMNCKHLRLENAVSWVGNAKYKTSHRIAVSEEIEIPANALYENN